MKKNRNIFTILTLLVTLFCSCGEDRTAEFDQLTQENQWIYSKMKEVYLWAGEIGKVQQKDYFAASEQFFKKLLNGQDNASFFSDKAAQTTGYGICYSLLRDPLNISPSKQYVLIEFVEPNSLAKVAGLERGMWVAEIDGKRVTASNAKSLFSGSGANLKIDAIEYDEENGKYYWESITEITLPAAGECAVTAIPAVEIIDDITVKNGYILCNEFDGEEMATALATIVQGGADNIVLDLRYNSSNSLEAAAEVAAPFIPADKQGAPFCFLSKAADGAEKESMPLPQSDINVSDKPLYIITTSRTAGVVNAFVKAVRTMRGETNVKIVGQPASGTNLCTECYESPYMFDINPATAYIFDAAGELLTYSQPDHAVNEYNGYYPIYPLGSKQENILYSISYIMENGTLPPVE